MWLLRLALILATCCAVNTHVSHVDVRNFKSFLQQNDLALVMFHAPWSSSYRLHSTEFIKASEKADGRFMFATVDCFGDEHSLESREVLCQEHGVRSFSVTIKLFKKGVSTPYHGTLKADHIVGWLEKTSGPVLKELASETDAITFVSHAKSQKAVALVAHFGTNNPNRALFAKIAHDALPQLCYFGVMDSEERDGEVDLYIDDKSAVKFRKILSKHRKIRKAEGYAVYVELWKWVHDSSSIQFDGPQLARMLDPNPDLSFLNPKEDSSKENGSLSNTKESHGVSSGLGSVPEDDNNGQVNNQLWNNALESARKFIRVGDSIGMSFATDTLLVSRRSVDTGVLKHFRVALDNCFVLDDGRVVFEMPEQGVSFTRLPSLLPILGAAYDSFETQTWMKLASKKSKIRIVSSLSSLREFNSRIIGAPESVHTMICSYSLWNASIFEAGRKLDAHLARDGLSRSNLGPLLNSILFHSVHNEQTKSVLKMVSDLCSGWSSRLDLEALFSLNEGNNITAFLNAVQKIREGVKLPLMIHFQKSKEFYYSVEELFGVSFFEATRSYLAGSRGAVVLSVPESMRPSQLSVLRGLLNSIFGDSFVNFVLREPLAVVIKQLLLSKRAEHAIFCTFTGSQAGASDLSVLDWSNGQLTQVASCTAGYGESLSTKCFSQIQGEVKVDPKLPWYYLVANSNLLENANNFFHWLQKEAVMMPMSPFDASDGAVEFARFLMEDKMVADANSIRLIARMAVPLGVAVANGQPFNNKQCELYFSAIVPENFLIPGIKSSSFTPSSDGQSTVRIRVLEGPCHCSTECREYTYFDISDLPTHIRKEEVHIGVTYHVNLDGTLFISSEAQTRTGTKQKRELRVQMAAASFDHNTWEKIIAFHAPGSLLGATPTVALFISVLAIIFSVLCCCCCAS